MGSKFGCTIVITVVGIFSSNALPVSTITDIFGNPMTHSSLKSPSYHPFHPQTSLMLTGYYRPSKGLIDNQAGSVYAQGASVGGGAYFEQPRYLMVQPDERQISTADASHEEPKLELPEDHPDHTQNTLDPSTQTTSFEHPPTIKPATIMPKKDKKVLISTEEEDYDDDEADYEDDIPITDRQQKTNPGSISYFPMMFSFPKSSGGSSTGPVMAVANSYSTGRAGVASSVATAYGASPKKKIRTHSSKKINK